MNRRDFFRSGLFGSLGLAALAGSGIRCSPESRDPANRLQIAGLNLDELAAELREQLFEQYLPFWENGGYDAERGGFMCYLHDDGSVQDDRKDIWYQGRGIWVYSYLYNNLDPDPKWLDIAQRSRDFMVAHMHRGDGTWLDTVNRQGEPVEGIDMSRGGNIYGALFAAVGLIQLARATGSDDDLNLAKLTIRKSVERYEDPGYPGVSVPETGALGLRAQGHSFMFTWVVPQLLELDPDPWLESLAREHMEHLAEDFWNPEFGISNETLFHDYSRIPELAERMVPGHSIEAQWMGMVAAKQLGDEALAGIFRDRFRRLVEMSWDYVFGGIGDTDFSVTPSASSQVTPSKREGSGHASKVAQNESGTSSTTPPLFHGPNVSIKSMWAQTEVLVGTMLIYSDTGAAWARDWYERTWEYVQRTMTTDYGVWRQAVDRRGNPVDRPGISPYRKGNFHQPRSLMMNLVALDCMMDPTCRSK